MELEVRIERLGAQGDGVAKALTLFVPFTLPGERVQVAIKPSKDHAEPLAILEPSPDRVAPVCPHLGSAAAVRSSIWRASLPCLETRAGVGGARAALLGRSVKRALPSQKRARGWTLRSAACASPHEL